MEELLPVLFVIGYLVLSVLGRLVQGKKKSAGEEEIEAEKEPSAIDRMLREMMRQAGVEQVPGIPPEPPVASEHRPTRSEHRPTASEQRPTWTETIPTSSEHVRTASETFVTRSEHVARASEHRLSTGEHRKGDAVLPPIPMLPPAVKHRRRSKLGQALVSDLRGGRRPLARAIVLREILGPPVGMRDLDERS